MIKRSNSVSDPFILIAIVGIAAAITLSYFVGQEEEKVSPPATEINTVYQWPLKYTEHLQSLPLKKQEDTDSVRVIHTVPLSHQTKIVSAFISGTTLVIQGKNVGQAQETKTMNVKDSNGLLDHITRLMHEDAAIHPSPPPKMDQETIITERILDGKYYRTTEYIENGAISESAKNLYKVFSDKFWCHPNILSKMCSDEMKNRCKTSPQVEGCENLN